MAGPSFRGSLAPSDSGPVEGSSTRAFDLAGWLRLAALVFAGLWIYGPTLSGDWLWDDYYSLCGNPYVRDPAGLLKVLVTADGLGNYYPLTSLVRWIQWQLWGDYLPGYHLTSLGLQLCSTLLIWRLFRRLGLAEAWWGALLFMVHPIMVESVAWMTELKNTLALPPLLFAFLALLRYEEKGHRRLDYIVALYAFEISLLAKTTGVMLPIVYLGYLWCRRGRMGWAELKASGPFLALALFPLGSLSGFSLSPVDILTEILPTGGILARFASVGWSIFFLLGKCLLPIDLLPAYPSPAVETAGPVDFVPWLLLAAIFVLFWWKRASWGLPLLAGFGFFLANLTPVLLIVFMSYASMVWSTDHLLYVPIIGLIGLFPVGVAALRGALGPGWQPWVTGGLVSLMIALACLAQSHARIFVDDETLWRHTVERRPHFLLAHENLGMALLRKGDFDEARPHFEEVIRGQPQHAVDHFFLGQALVKQGRLEEGRQAFLKAQELNPEMIEFKLHLGQVLVQLGQLGEARAAFEQVLKKDPKNAEAAAGLASLKGKIP